MLAAAQDLSHFLGFFPTIVIYHLMINWTMQWLGTNGVWSAQYSFVDYHKQHQHKPPESQLPLTTGENPIPVWPQDQKKQKHRFTNDLHLLFKTTRKKNAERCIQHSPSTIVGGWTNPFEKYTQVTLDHFPRDENKKYGWNHHPVKVNGSPSEGILRRKPFNDCKTPPKLPNDCRRRSSGNVEMMGKLAYYESRPTLYVLRCDQNFFEIPTTFCWKKYDIFNAKNVSSIQDTQ